MSEERICNFMEYVTAAAHEADLDVEPFYRLAIELRPGSALAQALEDEISERAVRRTEGMGV